VLLKTIYQPHWGNVLHKTSFQIYLTLFNHVFSPSRYKHMYLIQTNNSHKCQSTIGIEMKLNTIQNSSRHCRISFFIFKPFLQHGWVKKV